MRADLVRCRTALLAAVASVLLILGLTSMPSVVAPAHALDPGYARLTLTELTPSTVTSAGGDVVRVRGRVTNTFDRPIKNLKVRVQLGAQVRTAVGLRTSLMAPASAFPVLTPQRSVADTISPGENAAFDLEVPISGPGGLQIEDTGVYPLLVSVTGVPESGGLVQVAESRSLLPVLSLPADSRRASGFVDPAYGGGDTRLGRDGSLAPDTSEPAALTMIWPLAATPQLAPGVLGGATEPVRLISDRLAESLKPEGRLGAQLAALEKVAQPDGPNAGLRDGLCVAVDPDLLVTVHGMTLGYVVSDDPSDPRSDTTPGTGKADARAWIAQLRSIAEDLCVTALPFAQAGLDSLSTIGDEELSTTAVNGAADIVDALLGVESARDVTIPAVGTLSTAGRDVLTSQGRTAAAVASSAVEPDTSDALGRYRSGDVGLQTYDAPISAALGAAGTRPAVPSIMPSWQQPDLREESPVSRRQTALAALAFPMLTVPDSDDGMRKPVTGRSAFVMPPTYWSPTAEDSEALLGAADLLLASGTARQVPLRDVAGSLPDATENAPLVTPGDTDALVAKGFPISSAQAGEVRSNVALTSQLKSSLVGSPDTVTTPQAYVAPLYEDALRAIATPETQTLEQARQLRTMRIGAVSSTLDHMRQAVTLLDPGGRYTLASERSPLLLIVRNDLALPIRVEMDIDAPEALNVGELGVQEIPPLGTRQIQIPTHASSSERATVNIAMVTSTGVPLSEPITLSIYSNAYGKALFWITIIAGVLLVLLVARRLWHRFTGEPDPADEDRPEPDADEIRLASTPYEQRLDLTREEREEREESGDPPPGDRKDP